MKGRAPCCSMDINFWLYKIITCGDLLYSNVPAVHNTVLYAEKIKRAALMLSVLTEIKKENIQE